MAATTEEEAIIKYRYMTHTVTTTANALPPLKAITHKFFQFREQLRAGRTAEARAAAAEMAVELHGLQAVMDRLAAAARVARREADDYAAAHQELESSIGKMHLAIEEQKVELASARLELARLQEYEAVKRGVTAAPRRSATRREMEGVAREVADLRAATAELESTAARRRGALTSLLAHMARVCAEIEAEAPEEEGALPDAEPGTTR